MPDLDIFPLLVSVRKHIQASKPDLVTSISFTDLPWQLVRNAQSLSKLNTYMEKNPSSEGLQKYIEDNTEERLIRGKSKSVNIGIENLKF